MDHQAELLRQFVTACKVNPDLLHEPKFAFYKEYLESLGAQIPPKKAKEPEPMESETLESPEEPEFDLPPLELDESGVIRADSGELLPMGDPNKEASEDDLEKANEERNKATEAFSEGNFDDALKHFTNAIELNPGSAMLHAKRANVLLKLKKPVAAIRDCDKAISINADSAPAYKFRGRANRLIGNWLRNHRRVAQGGRAKRLPNSHCRRTKSRSTTVPRKGS
ncbi:hypothetical protein L596_018943 [Steinernema carpocapsae]|uniref:Hsp70-interacting protein N-terminal domain-containing protein n=1 Tax=Steinernema carpocapsae TaxID=34508 RepID=A0A4U5N676_STECR|nr:hypothetical protein L596_018943 [Steinernema carpocapsae]